MAGAFHRPPVTLHIPQGLGCCPLFPGQLPTIANPGQALSGKRSPEQAGRAPKLWRCDFQLWDLGQYEPLYACLLICTVRMRGALRGSLLLGVQSRALPPLFQWVLFSKAS